MRANEILTLINSIIEACEPIAVKDFNVVIKEKRAGNLLTLEKSNNKLGIRLFDYTNKKEGYAVSTLSLFATITDCFINKRIMFIIKDGFIDRAEWYKGN